MINKAKYSFLFTIAIFSVLTLLSTNSLGTGNEKLIEIDLEIIDVNGNIDFTDVLTSNDNFLNSHVFSKNGFVINVINKNGVKVYCSENKSDSFNLESMPKGEYIINIYKENVLINSNKITQLNQLIVT